MIRHVIILFLFGAGLWACSDAYHITAVDNSMEVSADIPGDPAVDSIVSPYQKELATIMNVAIAYAPEDFTKARPNGVLNNWAADAILDHELIRNRTDYDSAVPVMCLLNFGGLRNPISKGSVTVGDIYKLMPFDNEIVWVELPWESVTDIADYLQKSGGEPIAGARLEKDTLLFDNTEVASASFWVVTSDYLMNGGDHMDFFKEQQSYHYGSGLMRDAMREEAKRQDTLIFDNEKRIQL